MDLGLSDRVFIITGGARGLGRATADVLVAEGARVVLSGRSEDALREAAGDAGDAVETLSADNAEASTPSRLLDAARARWGRVDGALISVGGPPKGSVGSTTDEQWTAAFESVFLGAVRLGREIGAALPPGGSLAFVLSSSVRAALPDMAISNGLRPGLAMVAKTLADELGPAGVRVNGLLPGRVGTERVAELDALSGDAEAAKAATVRTIPLGRYGEPEEFGRVAAFLLSPASSFVSGAMVPVDGGMLRSL
ncbi:MAG: SDR family oxidoreductase [Nocardioides sp.]